MSYILDALRKADAERERDPARGIHAQPVPAPVAAASRWPWVAGAVALGAGVAIALFWPRAPDRVQPAPPSVAPPTIAAPAPAAPAVLPAAPPPAPVVAAVPEKARASAPVASAASGPAAPAAAASAPSPALATAPAAAPTDRVYAPAELPPEIQRELPRLAVSGGVHSDNPSQRMLIVGGQVVNEGAEVAPGVRLEEIRPKSAVLRYRGYRYALPY